MAAVCFGTETNCLIGFEGLEWLMCRIPWSRQSERVVTMI